MKVNVDLDYILTLYQKIIHFLMLVFLPWLGKIMSLFLEARNIRGKGSYNAGK